MSATTDSGSITVALIGNPNTGKSTLFTGLCGVRQKTGNYPGVTVERKIGAATWHERHFSLVDLPGAYSLAPRSADEMVAVDVLLGRREDTPPPDVVLCIVDASNLERNLFLVSQVMDLGRPVVVALNMTDVAEAQGKTIDVAQLERRLGVPIVPVQANKNKGFEDLRQRLTSCAEESPVFERAQFPDWFESELDRISGTNPNVPQGLLKRLLLDTSGYLLQDGHAQLPQDVIDEAKTVHAKWQAEKRSLTSLEAITRYKWIGAALAGVTKRSPKSQSMTQRVDSILTHRVWGTLIFAAVMMLLFLGVFYVATPVKALADWAIAWLSFQVESLVPEGPVQSLLSKGVIGGAGGVLPFLPQIMLLFLFLGILEDCGYMARAAYLMDRLMAGAGLSGKSFIPLLSSFACAVPGILGARVVENPRDRLVTMLVAPLMSCSARLPVYVLLCGAFLPSGWTQALTMFSMYLIGIVAAVGAAWTFKRTILRGPTPSFILEMPTFKWPSLTGLFIRVFESARDFVYRAGTMIVAVSIVVWAASYYPRSNESIDPALLARQDVLKNQLKELDEESPERAELEHSLVQVTGTIESLHLENSYLGRLGHAMEPVTKPLGWDWRIACAAVASFPAREVVVATLGVLFRTGEEGAENGSLAAALQEAKWSGQDTPLFNIPVALSVMVFFALCSQCASTLVILKQETRSWRWPLFTFAYMTGLAYLAAFVVYQVGMWITRSFGA